MSQALDPADMSTLLPHPVAIDLNIEDRPPEANPEANPETNPETNTKTNPVKTPIHRFDGIICFGGEDWWYHNRGHYDLRMMDQFSDHVPVLYVNSLGMRIPRPGEGRMFVRRISRKLRSITRGVVRIHDRFSVYSPFTIPGPRGMRLMRHRLAAGVTTAAKQCGIRRPLLWIACPPAAEILDQFDPAILLYQRTDRYELFPGVDRDHIKRCDGWLKARADATVFCSSWLHDREHDDCQQAMVIDHGVDYQRFSVAGTSENYEPHDIRDLPRPRVGFVGGIDGHTFDPELFTRVAALLPEVHFVLVGGCSLPAGWCEHENVSLLGRKPLDQVADYMGACDVLIMPWRQGAWIEAANPVKLKEYLAVGRPVVSTPFPALKPYEGVVQCAKTPELFARAIRQMLDDPGDSRHRQRSVEGCTWKMQAGAAAHLIESLGGKPEKPWSFGVSEHTRFTPRSSGIGQHQVEILNSVPRSPSGELQSNDPEPDDQAKKTSSTVDIAACLLLAGGLRPSPLASEAGHSVLDLHLTADRTVLDLWVEAARAACRNPSLPIRVLHGEKGLFPEPSHLAGGVSIEQEPVPYRGPAGVVFDACRAYSAHQHVLVMEAARFPAGCLPGLLARHMETGAEISMGVQPDHSPAGVWVIRCGSLASIASCGFVDLKEQWLPQILQAGRDARVVRLSEPGVLPLHTRREFLRAVQFAHSCSVHGETVPPDSRETSTGSFRVVCRGALIGPGATITDSIIMPGAVIGAGATVDRSVIPSRSEIKMGEKIADAVVRTRHDPVNRSARCA